MPHEIPLLYRKPDFPVLAKHQGMRIGGFRIGHGIFGDLPGGRIEFADMGRAVSGVPDLPFLIDNQIVRTGAGIQFELVKLARLQGPARQCNLHPVPRTTRDAADPHTDHAASSGPMAPAIP